MKKAKEDVEELATSTLLSLGLVRSFYNAAIAEARAGEPGETIDAARAQANHARELLKGLNERLEDTVTELEGAYVKASGRLA